MESYDTLFQGVKRIHGTRGLHQIKAAHIAVIGLGGVGSWAVESLVRSGVGTLTIIDGDVICPTNSNRQLHTHSESYFKPKAEVLAHRMLLINPELSIQPIVKFISKNTLEHLPSSLDFVIDAIDRIKDKAALINHCTRHKIPIITAGGAAGKLDPGQITIKDLAGVINDPLLAKLRSTLRRNYGFSKNPRHRMRVRAVFSTQQIFYPQPDGTTSHQRAEDNGHLLSKKRGGGLGASMCVTASFGMTASAYVLKKITEKNR